MATDSTTRFSSRVADYVKYRPDYPAGVLDVLRHECGLTPAAVVADVGSGTGLSSRLLLRNGNRVFGIEPNAEMRAAAEQLLAGEKLFVSIDGIAEATTLAGGSIDFVIAGQAFHWFDRPRTRTEFQRILRPGGWVVLLWNDRRTDSTPFLREYEQLLQTFGTDYKEINHVNIDPATLQNFYGAVPMRSHVMPHRQIFDFDGLRGRLLSCSYVPAADDPRYAPMLQEVARIFAAYQQNGCVSVDYDTRVYSGQLIGPIGPMRPIGAI